MWSRLARLIERLQTYSWWQVAIELAVIWVVVYAIIRFVQGTRAAGALKGTLLLLLFTTLLIRVVGASDAFQRVKFLYDHFLTLLAITLIVVFQPELRRGLIRLGETPLLRRSGTAAKGAIDAIVDASIYLSRAKFGGLIVIERETSLKGLVEGGTPINGQLSARLLQTIFFPGSALHDLAVTVAGTTVKAAGVQLPLAEPDEMPDPSLGSRHRAAVGLSKECDALVVVVSEETGAISLAERGRLDQNLDADRLRRELTVRLSHGKVAFDSSNGEHADLAPHPLQPLELHDPRD
jgi:diadenylate cyclase